MKFLKIFTVENIFIKEITQNEMKGRRLLFFLLTETRTNLWAFYTQKKKFVKPSLNKIFFVDANI